MRCEPDSIWIQPRLTREQAAARQGDPGRICYNSPLFPGRFLRLRCSAAHRPTSITRNGLQLAATEILISRSPGIRSARPPH